MNFFRKQFLFILLVIFFALWVVYWLYWHLTPFTADAFVFANTRAVTPWVAGYITQIHVKNNQPIKQGEPLFSIYAPPYALKVKILEHGIATAKAKLAAIRSATLQAEAEIDGFDADIANSCYLYTRAQEMLKSAAISEDYTVLQKRNLKVDLSRKSAAIHKVQSLRHEAGALEAELKRLSAELDLAEIWHSQTTVTALCDGIVTNMMLSPGSYCKPGEVLFAIVDTSQWYVQANFKESELSEISPGTRAIIRLRQYPGKIYHGTVQSVPAAA